ncbi:hypothetical protein Taro_016065 [Colocasia esculenta]|uniref:Uncharacterized protein n=1 Tax=Colocasia esculenta TaxID=4460 RepID=A0A843UJM5_COLES|nr:hypothetical protein [Colocasia esculenta]
MGCYNLPLLYKRGPRRCSHTAHNQTPGRQDSRGGPHKLKRWLPLCSTLRHYGLKRKVTHPGTTPN